MERNEPPSASPGVGVWGNSLGKFITGGGSLRDFVTVALGIGGKGEVRSVGKLEEAQGKRGGEKEQKK